jgi:hypothetical protein
MNLLGRLRRNQTERVSPAMNAQRGTINLAKIEETLLETKSVLEGLATSYRRRPYQAVRSRHSYRTAEPIPRAGMSAARDEFSSLASFSRECDTGKVSHCPSFRQSDCAKYRSMNRDCSKAIVRQPEVKCGLQRLSSHPKRGSNVCNAPMGSYLRF